MLILMRSLIVGLCVCVVFSSCNSRKVPDQRPLYPVKGEVTVDGKPVADVRVNCTDVKDVDRKELTGLSATTKEDGKFEVSTYYPGDGAPEGEYVVTFSWDGRPAAGRPGGRPGPDKLNNRYSDPKKSQVRFKVEKGKPTDLGKIELTTEVSIHGGARATTEPQRTREKQRRREAH
jgi:hypothetical protein